MKIIPTVLMVCMLTSTSYFTQAQNNIKTNDSKKFYFRVASGYSFASGKTEFNDADPNGLTGIMQSTDVSVSADGSSANVKSLNGTLGAGVKGNFTIGYMFNPYIGAEIAVNYFHSDKTMIGRLTGPQASSEENAHLRGFDIAPGILVTPNLKTINPYARIGLIVPIAGKLNIETMARKANGGGPGTDIMVEARSKVKSRFSIGYYGALGVNFPIHNNLSIFGEVEIKNLSIKSKSAEITEYTTKAISGEQSQLVPGQQLADLPVYQKQFDFIDSYSQSTTAPPNQETPRKIPTEFVNVSSTGINFGVRFAFLK